MRKKKTSLIYELEKLSNLLSTINQRFDKDFYQLQDTVQELLKFICKELEERELLLRITDLHKELENIFDEKEELLEQNNKYSTRQLLLQDENNKLKENNDALKKELASLRISLVEWEKSKAFSKTSGDEATPIPTGQVFARPSISKPVFRGEYWDSPERQTALINLKKFVSGSKDIVIIDPYFYRGGTSTSEDEIYIRDLIEIIPPKNIESLHIISNQDFQSAAIKNRIEEKYGVKLTNAFTFKFHDRVWIADGFKARLVGTSLNSIGKKVAFILPLPYFDLESLKKELKRFNLLFDKNKGTTITLKSIDLDDFINYASDQKVLFQYLLG
ncbi:hypothetical protein ACFWMS_25035 [Peribacillus butanolivorans]|uniref:hypothetical protein n=1 Tax=Peribacillus butanolivorans TaxID=421767 RepID=UPI0036552413